jgi:hypothetical protein
VYRKIVNVRPDQYRQRKAEVREQENDFIFFYKREREDMK